MVFGKKEKFSLVWFYGLTNGNLHLLPSAPLYFFRENEKEKRYFLKIYVHINKYISKN